MCNLSNQELIIELLTRLGYSKTEVYPPEGKNYCLSGDDYYWEFDIGVEDSNNFISFSNDGVRLNERYESNSFDLINEKMKDWTVERVEEAKSLEEVKFIFHLKKGDNKRLVFLAANDLGAWLHK